MMTCEALGDLVMTILDVDAANWSQKTVLQDLPSWDSVNALRLLIHLEAMLATTLPPEMLEEPLSIQALHETIVARLEW